MFVKFSLFLFHLAHLTVVGAIILCQKSKKTTRIVAFMNDISFISCKKRITLVKSVGFPFDSTKIRPT